MVRNAFSQAGPFPTDHKSLREAWSLMTPQAKRETLSRMRAFSSQHAQMADYLVVS